MVIFYAFTPYHVFNCLNLKINRHNNDKGILFLIDPDENRISDFCSIEKLHNVFNGVICIDSGEIEYDRGILKKISSYIIRLHKVKLFQERLKKLTFNETVDAIYTYGSSPELYVIDDFIRRYNNTDVKLITYEEGAGSYCWKADNALNNIFTLYLRFILNVKTRDDFDKLLLYMPECLSYKKVCEIGKMPTIDSSSNKDAFSKVFKGVITHEEQNVLLLGPDQNIDFEISSIFSKLDSHQLFARMHPRTKHWEKYDKLKKSNNMNGLWEMVCMNSPMKDMVLISYSSTASFTPKMIYDEEPFLVFLHCLQELNSDRFIKDEGFIKQEIKEMILKFMHSYRDPSRIFFPSNVDELEKILYKLKVCGHYEIN